MAQQQFTCTLIITALVVLAVGQVNCDLLPGFERCDTTDTELEHFYVSACPRGPAHSPCKIKRNQMVDFELDFVSGQDFTSASSKIDIADFGYSYDACQLGLECPSSAGQKQSMVQQIRIHDGAQVRQSSSMEFYLFDDKTHKRLVCVKFPIEIV